MTIHTNHMDETATSFTLPTGDFYDLEIRVHLRTDASGHEHVRAYMHEDRGLWWLQTKYPVTGFLPQLAADVFASKICGCQQYLVFPPNTLCRRCSSTARISIAKQCVICLSDEISWIGKKCATCVDGIICHGCLLSCKTPTSCPLCKSLYPVLKRKFDRDDDE